MRAAAGAVQRLREDFLAGTRFAQQQDRDIALGYPLGDLHIVFQLRVAEMQAVEGRIGGGRNGRGRARGALHRRVADGKKACTIAVLENRHRVKRFFDAAVDQARKRYIE